MPTKLPGQLGRPTTSNPLNLHMVGSVGYKRIHIDVDDLPLAGRGDCFPIFLGHAQVAVSSAPSSLTPRATILRVPSESGRCNFKTSSDDAVIQVSTSVCVVRITGIAFGWMAPPPSSAPS